jgi:hypothetical protein
LRPSSNKGVSYKYLEAQWSFFHWEGVLFSKLRFHFWG